MRSVLMNHGPVENVLFSRALLVLLLTLSSVAASVDQDCHCFYMWPWWPSGENNVSLKCLPGTQALCLQDSIRRAQQTVHWFQPCVSLHLETNDARCFSFCFNDPRCGPICGDSQDQQVVTPQGRVHVRYPARPWEMFRHKM